MVFVTMWCLPRRQRNSYVRRKVACRSLITTPRQGLMDTSCFRMRNDSELVCAAIEFKMLVDSEPEMYDLDLEDWTAYLFDRVRKADAYLGSSEDPPELKNCRASSTPHALGPATTATIHANEHQLAVGGHPHRTGGPGHRRSRPMRPSVGRLDYTGVHRRHIDRGDRLTSSVRDDPRPRKNNHHDQGAIRVRRQFRASARTSSHPGGERVLTSTLGVSWGHSCLATGSKTLAFPRLGTSGRRPREHRSGQRIIRRSKRG